MRNAYDNLVTIRQHRKLYECDDHSCVHRTPRGFLGQSVEVCSLDTLKQEGSGPGDTSHSEVSERSHTENYKILPWGK